MKKPDNAKERNLIKGALRRVFSRSEVRRRILSDYAIKHEDVNRPRVTRWAWCADCGVIDAAYKMEVDHKEPVIPLNKTLEDMSWDELVDRLWCEPENLQCVCKDCHKVKTKAETKERKRRRL